jgi:hypothetical protein
MVELGSRFRGLGQVRQIGAPVVVGHHGDRRRPRHLDSRSPPRGAASTIGSDQVSRAHLEGLPGLERPCVDDVTFRLLGERQELRRVEHRRPGRSTQRVEQHFLDRILRDQALPGRGVLQVGLGPGPAVLVAGHRLDEHEHVGLVAQAARPNRRLHAPLAEQLHRAYPAAAGFRVVGGRGAAFDDHVADSKAMQQQRHRKARRPTADDEDGHRGRKSFGESHVGRIVMHRGEHS